MTQNSAWNDHVFSDMAEIEEARQGAFQASVAEYLRRRLLKAGVAAPVGGLEKLMDAVQFPWYLCPVKIPYIHKITLADLFARFTKLPFVTAFAEEQEIYAGDVPMALVFSWPSVAAMMVCHADDTLITAADGTLLVRYIKRLKQALCLQRFDSFISAILQRHYSVSGN